MFDRVLQQRKKFSFICSQILKKLIMKKIKILLITLLFPVLVFSQGVEIVPFAGYMFGGSVKYIGGQKLKIDNGMDYGISVFVPVQSLVDLELNYTRMDSKATYYPLGGLDRPQANLGTNYFQVGGISNFINKIRR